MDNYIDTSVIIVFSVFVLVIGMLFARTGKNMKAFFAGGEAVPWFIGGLSLFMSFFSAGTFVAWGSIAYKSGWVAITIQWTMAIGAFVTAFWLAPRWKKTGNLTAAEFIQQRLGTTVQKVYVNIFLAVSVFQKGVVLYPVAKLVSVSLGFPLVPTTIILGVLMISYTAVGGLWAVMVTDILQFVVLSAAVTILLPLTLDAAGGFSNFIEKAPPHFFSLLSSEYNGWFIVAFTFYHILYIGGNWTFVQRFTSVDSAKFAKKVALLFGALYLISPVIWMLPPMLFQTINPLVSDPENAYLLVCKTILPAGLMGLMLTGMYFSTSATANTTLNVASAIFTNDIYKNLFRPDATDKRLMQVARLSSWALGTGMIIIALLVPQIGGMVNVVISIAAITAGPLFAPPVWALISKKLTGKSTLWITLVTLVANFLFIVLLPALFNYQLNKGWQMLFGISMPLLLLAINEWMIAKKDDAEYTAYTLVRHQKENKAIEETNNSTDEAKRQNYFGLKVIAGALVFTALLLFILAFITTRGRSITNMVAVVVLLLAIVPWHFKNKFK